MTRHGLFVLMVVTFGCAESGPAATSASAPTAAPPPSQPVAAPAAVAPPSPASVAPSAPRVAPPTTPAAIKAPETATPVLKALAKGVQIYVCGAQKDAAGKFAWTLKAPEAELADDNGKPLGKHYGGPTWEAVDGSKVVGAMKAKVDAPSPSAIPWLLIEAKSNEGQGVLSHVAFVQRVDTEGGAAPNHGCDKAHDKAETRVDYSAVYYFYVATSDAASKAAK